MANFEASVLIRSTPEAVYDFLSRPANILKINPPDLDVTIMNAPSQIERGSKIELQMQTMGFSQNMVHEVTQCDPPRGFTETQVQGPLQAWVHEHIIEPTGNGEVKLTDRIRFEPPGGFVGFMVTESKIRSSLESSFAHQHQALKRILEQGNA